LTDTAAIERFQAIYAEQHRRVYAYAVSMAGRQLADEVVSEVFLSPGGGSPTCRPRPCRGC
jgi:RNA polymerase sigma-70 factor, ECF subfamily